jgi:hypothetical protein
MPWLLGVINCVGIDSVEMGDEGEVRIYSMRKLNRDRGKERAVYYQLKLSLTFWIFNQALYAAQSSAILSYLIGADVEPWQTLVRPQRGHNLSQMTVSPTE